METDEQEEGEASSSPQARPKTKPARCIICSEEAEFCVRGVPGDCYCRECAEEFFQSPEDLDKL